MEYKFSDKVSKLHASAIREILKFTADPEVISFAAGNPAPEAFPKEEIAKISAELLRDDPILALQYSITEGYTPLRDFLKGWMTEKGCFHKEFDDLIITSGGQQANELSCKVLLNEGDTLLVPVKELVKKEVYSKNSPKNTEIVIAKLGNDAGIIGAAFLGRAN